MSPLLLALLVAQAVEGSGQEGYTPAADAQPPLRILGYVDLGWARAQGNGTSFARGDTRVPADYGVDAFAPAVNSRGEVASSGTPARCGSSVSPRAPKPMLVTTPITCPTSGEISLSS